MKRLLLLLSALCLAASCAFADPLAQLEDYSNSITIANDGSDPSAGRFEYTFRYPHVDGKAEGGAEINAFYEDLVDYTENFTVPMNMDAYEYADFTIRVDYTVTCNNDDYFSVLVRSEKNSPDQTLVFWEGHVFSRKNPTPGLTCTLPRYLGILSSGESDTWLQDRQTARADSLLVSMVWQRIQENAEGVEYWPELTEEELSQIFFPEQDFYLDENGDPVFFLQPGAAAPESAGLLAFPISLEEIEDEM